MKKASIMYQRRLLLTFFPVDGVVHRNIGTFLYIFSSRFWSVKSFKDFHGTNSSWCSLDQTNTPGCIFHQTFLNLGLRQSVSFRTHLDSLGNLTPLLDLLLVSEKHLVEEIDSLPPLGASDHVTVYCCLRFTASKASQLECRRVWCYNKADRKALNAALSKVVWSNVQQAPDTDSA